MIGQGVIGLTTALKLSEHNFEIEIFSNEPFELTTSMSAGAYWWPHKTYPQERVLHWAKETLDEYRSESLDSDTGIHFEPHLRFCVDHDDSAYVLQLLGDWENIDATKHNVFCQEAYSVKIPVIDVPTYIPYLRQTLENKGVKFHLLELNSPSELFGDFDLVINCSGVGARELVNDSEVFPIRGQSVRVTKPENLQHSTRLYQNQDAFTLILPRRNDVILGGTAQINNWDRTPDPVDTQNILQSCIKLVPAIVECEILGTTVGLRPGRSSVRLELERMYDGNAVIHNYGHGGGGFTVAWGCANEVVELATNYFSNRGV